MILWVAAGVVFGVLLIAFNLRALAAMALGERMTQGLGHNPKQVQILTVLGVAVLVGCATAGAGPIAFGGLVVPFLVRALVGAEFCRCFYLALRFDPVCALRAI